MKTVVRPETEMKESGASWMGKIPCEWSVSKLKWYLRRIDPRNPGDKQVLSLYREYGVIPKDSRDDNHNATSEDTSKYKYVRVGDFVVNKMKAWQGSVAVSEYDGIVSPAYYVYHFTDDSYHRRYFHYLLRSCYKEEFMRLSGGIRVGQWDLNSKALDNVLIVIPKKEEQQAIADYLDETCSKIDEIIAEAKASIDEYKELKQSVITEAVLHGFEEKSVKHSSIEWIGDYNAEFGMTRIGRFCFVTKLAGFEYTNAMADSIVNEFGVPIVRAQNVKMFKFYSDKIGEFIPKDISFQLNRSSLNKKCLLITFIGAGIGDVCVFDEKERYHLAPNVAKIEIFDEYKCLLDEHYLMYYLGSEAGQGEIRRISKASAQPSLSMETIRSINVVLPPFDVQEQIVKYLNKKMLHMDSLIAEKESLINDLEAYKKSLIYEVVTGKRRVV